MGVDWQVEILPFTLPLILGLVALLLLLIISALVSGSEVAFFSLSPNDKEKLKQLGRGSADKVLQLLLRPNRLLASILIANNFVNVAIVILSTYLTTLAFDFSNAPKLGFLFQVVLVTFLLILFGEIIPKIYASSNPVGFSRMMASSLSFSMIVFKPIINVLIFITFKVKSRVAKNKENISLDDLSDVLKLSPNVVTEDKDILEGIVKFSNLSVKEVMRSRVDIVAIDINTGFTELLKIIQESGFSRIPVYSQTLDEIKGILYIKDILPHLEKDDEFRWQVLMRSSYVVPENKPVNELLKEIQENKTHMAMVIDEYGGIQGLITLEDILEEIVGEITDEKDQDQNLYVQISDDHYEFLGKISLIDFCKVLELEDDLFDDVKGDAETLAGLILELKEDIPMLHSKISFKHLTFEVLDVDTRRVKRLGVKRNKLAEKKS